MNTTFPSAPAQAQIVSAPLVATPEKTFEIFLFPGVLPINSVEEGIRLGNYTRKMPNITDSTVPLLAARGEMDLIVVKFKETICRDDRIRLLESEGMEPCEFSPNYLLGLMIRPDSEMPDGLKNKDIVAVAKPGSPRSHFTSPKGEECLLYVDRSGDGDRYLDLAPANGGCYVFRTYLAQRMRPKTPPP